MPLCMAFFYRSPSGSSYDSSRNSSYPAVIELSMESFIYLCLFMLTSVRQQPIHTHSCFAEYMLAFRPNNFVHTFLKL